MTNSQKTKEEILNRVKNLEKYNQTLKHDRRTNSTGYFLLEIQWQNLAQLLKHESVLSNKELLNVYERVDRVLDDLYSNYNEKDEVTRIEFLQTYLEMVQPTKAKKIQEKLKVLQAQKDASDRRRKEELELKQLLTDDYLLPSAAAYKLGNYDESISILKKAILVGENRSWCDSPFLQFRYFETLGLALIQNHDYQQAEEILMEQYGRGGLGDFDAFLDVELAAISLRRGDFEMCLRRAEEIAISGLRLDYDGWNPTCEMMNKVFSHMVKTCSIKAAERFDTILSMQQNLYTRRHQSDFESDARILPLLEIALNLFTQLKDFSRVAKIEKLIARNKERFHDDRLPNLDQAIAKQRRMPEFLAQLMRGFYPEDS